MPPTHAAAYQHLAATLVLELPRAEGERSTDVHPDHRFDPVAVFGRRAPLVVEVGAGSGDAAIAAARSRPDWDVLAFEVWRPGVGQALVRLVDDPPPNLRFVEVDVTGALRTMLAPGSVHELWTFFPDPWPKARHHKRRLITTGFVDLVCRVLEPAGAWRIATDWADYAEQVAALLGADPRFVLESTARAPLRPVTRFERRADREGRPVTEFTYRSAAPATR